MDKRTYNLIVGIITLIVSITFFVMPSIIRLDPFIPFMFALVLFIVALIFFFRGYSEK